jgi:hypothetical protein
MINFMTGYDISVAGQFVLIQSGHMVEFLNRSCLIDQSQPQHRLSGKAAFEAAFDSVAEFVLALKALPAGEIQLVSAVGWGDYFLQAVQRALKAHGQEDRKVVLAPTSAGAASF